MVRVQQKSATPEFGASATRDRGPQINQLLDLVQACASRDNEQRSPAHICNKELPSSSRRERIFEFRLRKNFAHRLTALFQGTCGRKNLNTFSVHHEIVLMLNMKEIPRHNFGSCALLPLKTNELLS
jgi:hypothetical protein